MEVLHAKVHISLLYPALIFGMPRQLFLLIGIATMALVFSLGQIWFLGVTAVLLAVARRICKEDRYVFEVYQQLFRLPDLLD